MNSLVKILGLMAAAGAAAFGLSKAKKLQKGGELLTFRVTGITYPEKRGAGILTGSFVTTIYSKLVNPSDQQFDVRVQSVKIYHINTELGYKKPSDNATIIPANTETSLEPIELEFPIANITQLVPLMADWETFKKQLTIRIDLVANGVPMVINEPVINQES